MTSKSDDSTRHAKAEQLIEQARQARNDERYAEATRAAQQAMQLSQQASAHFTLAHTQAMLGQIARDQRQNDAALQHYRDALQGYRNLGEAIHAAHALRHIGDIQRATGHFDEAEISYAEALAILRKNAHIGPLQIANAIRGLARLKETQKDRQQASQLWQQARTLYAHANVSAGVAECDQRLADLDADTQ